VRLRQGTRRPIGEGIAVPLLGHGVVVGQELAQHRIGEPAEALHAAQEVGVFGLDTLAHGAGAGLPDLEKIKDEVGIFVQDDEGDLPLGIGAPLRQVGQPRQVQPNVDTGGEFISRRIDEPIRRMIGGIQDPSCCL
jgi:hypothetical protein